MRVLIAGASGFLGHALVEALQRRGDQGVRLVRRAASGPGEISWAPARRELPRDALVAVDAVVNLSGENVGAGRWTARRRDAIFRSRIDATATLVDAIRAAERQPRVLVNASATGYYGNRGDQLLEETASRGEGFLAGVCEAWEHAAMRAAAAEVRVVCLRFGVVLAPGGGAVKKMLPLFRLGLGGRLGSGRQWMSWIHRADAIRVILHALDDATLAGAVNAVAPQPVTNREFTAVLGRALRRPTLFPVPRTALRLAFGAMADEALLGSTRVVPTRLLRAGFQFQHPTLTERAFVD